MAMTSDEVLAAMDERGLEPRKRNELWAVFVNDVRVRVPLAATAKEAVEAAVTHLDAREVAASERRARRIIQLQQRGDFFHHPRRVESADPDTGETITRTLFDIRRAEGNQATPIKDRLTVVEAWVDLARQLGVA